MSPRRCPLTWITATLLALVMVPLCQAGIRPKFPVYRYSSSYSISSSLSNAAIAGIITGAIMGSILFIFCLVITISHCNKRIRNRTTNGRLVCQRQLESVQANSGRPPSYSMVVRSSRLATIQEESTRTASGPPVYSEVVNDGTYWNKNVPSTAYSTTFGTDYTINVTRTEPDV